jgi:hypothetical protein
MERPRPPRPPSPTTTTTVPAAAPSQQQPAVVVVPADPLRTPLDLRRAAWALQQATATASAGHAAAAAAGGPGGSGVMRVNQVDASVLDGELLDLLRIQLAGILAPPFFPPGVMDR